MDLLAFTEPAAIRAGTAEAPSLPMAAMALADIMRTHTSLSFKAAMSAGSAGSEALPWSRRAMAARPRVTGIGIGRQGLAKLGDAPGRQARFFCFASGGPGFGANSGQNDIVHAQVVAGRRFALAQADVGQRVPPLAEADPADLVRQAHVGLGA